MITIFISGGNNAVMRLVSKAEGEKRILHFLDYLRTLGVNHRIMEKKRESTKHAKYVEKKETLLEV